MHALLVTDYNILSCLCICSLWPCHLSIVAASQCDDAHVCCLLLQDTWSHVEFKFTQHKGTDVYLVKMAEEDFEALEDNQVLVQVRQHHNAQ